MPIRTIWSASTVEQLDAASDRAMPSMTAGKSPCPLVGDGAGLPPALTV
jgi:hypothetical protein